MFSEPETTAKSEKHAERGEAVTYIEAIRLALRDEMRRDKSVFLIGEDIGSYGGAFGATKGLFEEFGPERVIDTPISESLIIGAAIGASLLGFRPVAEMQFADFIACGFDQVVNQAATIRYRYAGKLTSPIVIRCPSGGNIHGDMFHSQNPEGWFFHTPGLKIASPATVRDAYGLLKSAIRDSDPVLFFEYKYLYRRIKDTLPGGDFVVPLGKAEVRRVGTDLTILTYGPTLYPCLEAATELEREGTSVEVLDLRSLVPLDKEAIYQSVEKTNKALIVHEDYKQGGIGAEVAALLAEEKFQSLDGPIMRVASEDTPVPFAPPLEEEHLPTKGKILEAARRLAAY